MHSISTALQQIAQQLRAEFPVSPGVRRFAVPVSLNQTDPLAWLASQPVYPQFYWQQRNGDEEVAALGASRHFSTFDAAQAFLASQSDAAQRIWGLNAFDTERSALFLPRLEWRRHGGSVTLALTVCSDHSLADDARAGLAFIDALTPGEPLPTTPLDCVGERHFPDRAGWTQLINQATDAIAAGQFEKVVAARASDLQFSSPVSAAAFMAASRRVNLHCYHYFMAFAPDDAFLGSSPERLWRRIDSALRTEALAGTVANHPDEAKAQALGDWLMKDDKNQRENMLVVEDICQRLQNAVSSLDVLPPQIVRLRKVQHLRRCIWTELHQPDDSLCLHQLQPTAAVAGLPREPARRFIATHESFVREWYAGSAGYLSLKQTEFCVALRCARVTRQTVRLYAGAGIVAGSQPDEEWQEITNKAAGLRTLLVS
ncbi:isochorismate synthase MenF [Atlantibacter subterranea]|uniref:isochorismate synthase MenF n=1 Tax=Atlantibacter subterraneus TaxID=255519 RepID=UPI0020C2D39E|nr:isochorismate synthase MenF [Atlantibacter subterranea]UTJ46210.1 isochorismate synthase MenF [Atlantibacter subterranea]